MHTRSILGIIAGCLVAMPIAVLAHEADEKLGKVMFHTSCKPGVRAEFNTGVAMLHSYWFGRARQTFESVLQKDPDCAMAYWGIALDRLGNTLAFAPNAKDSQAAWEALETAHKIGARTARERAWIDAISTYFRDYDKRPNNARLIDYNAAMEALTRHYPRDYEAKVFYALTLQASAAKTDVTYANQIKSAALLEQLPRISLYTVSVEEIRPMCTELSPAVAAAVPPVVAAVLALAKQLVNAD